jgi:hypothetical protein
MNKSSHLELTLRFTNDVSIKSARYSTKLTNYAVLTEPLLGKKD